MGELVSVVIPVRNDAPAVPNAVASVLAQQADELVEIVLAVGPSDDGSWDVASELAAETELVRVIENPSGRTPEALNRAIAASRGDIVVRVDARSVLPANYLAYALETLRETNAGNVGSVQVPVGDTPTQRAIAAAMRSRIGSGGAAYRHAGQRRRVGTAYLGAFRRAALDAVGGYDESFERNQDAELNTRLNAAGHEVWLDPRLRVDYRPRASLRRLASQYWQYGWWRQRTLRKHPGTAEPRQYAVPAAVLGLVGSGVVAIVGPTWALAPIGGYSLALAGAAATADDLTAAERVTMIAALATMHFCWGAGFLASGVVSFASNTA